MVIYIYIYNSKNSSNSNNSKTSNNKHNNNNDDNDNDSNDNDSNDNSYTSNNTSNNANATNNTCVHVYVLYLHPVSITRFPLRRFSPGAGLLRYAFFIGSGVIFSRAGSEKTGIF